MANELPSVGDQRCAGPLIGIVRVERFAAGTGLYRNLELGRDQFGNGVRNQRDPPLARQRLLDDANLHSPDASRSGRAAGTCRANSAKSKYTRSPVNRPPRTGKKMTTR